jgi:uncharacterized protein (DUF4415 family)
MTLEEIETAPSLTDWGRLMNMDDATVTKAAKSDPDALPLGDAFFETARRLTPELLLKGNKQQITLRVDANVLDWFRAFGGGYQSRMNAVLKAYYETHHK